MSDKIATERLRQLLDERGVEWRYIDGTVYWHGERHLFPFSAWLGYNDQILNMGVCKVTPEQAVEATLGRGTCKVVTFADVRFCDVDEDEANYEYGMLAECSECGAIVLMPPEYVHYDRESLFAATNYCPNCGRRVES